MFKYTCQQAIEDSVCTDKLFDNNNPKQINTTNPYYHPDLYKKMAEQDESLASDDSGAREIYLKVARKQVCEETTKRLPPGHLPCMWKRRL